MTVQVNEYRTRDISLAAYLAERGLTLSGARRDPRTKHYEFVLADPDDTAEALAVNWSNSCCRRHEQRIMSLKALVNGKTGNGRA